MAKRRKYSDEHFGPTIERQVEPAAAPPFIHEALMTAARTGGPVVGSTWVWLQLRASRSRVDDDRNRGIVGPREVHAHAVSHLERYLECPFKYFAQHVLALDEERQDESVLTPQERGQLLHAVFEQFFDAWHAEGNGAITAGNLPAALALFERIADARLAALSETDRSLERTYLLGSAVAPGLAERAFAFEIEHDIGVVMDLSDRVVVLDYGRLIADGTPEEVARNRDVIDAYLGVAH